MGKNKKGNGIDWLQSCEKHIFRLSVCEQYWLILAYTKYVNNQPIHSHLLSLSVIVS